MITKSFPSDKNKALAKFFNGETLSLSAIEKLQELISPMYLDVFLDSGVPKHLINKYHAKKLKGKREREQQKKNK